MASLAQNQRFNVLKSPGAGAKDTVKQTTVHPIDESTLEAHESQVSHHPIQIVFVGGSQPVGIVPFLHQMFDGQFLSTIEPFWVPAGSHIVNTEQGILDKESYYEWETEVGSLLVHPKHINEMESYALLRRLSYIEADIIAFCFNPDDIQTLIDCVKVYKNDGVIAAAPNAKRVLVGLRGYCHSSGADSLNTRPFATSIDSTATSPERSPHKPSPHKPNGGAPIRFNIEMVSDAVPRFDDKSNNHNNNPPNGKPPLPPSGNLNASAGGGSQTSIPLKFVPPSVVPQGFPLPQSSPRRDQLSPRLNANAYLSPSRTPSMSRTSSLTSMSSFRFDGELTTGKASLSVIEHVLVKIKASKCYEFSSDSSRIDRMSSLDSILSLVLDETIPERTHMGKACCGIM